MVLAHGLSVRKTGYGIMTPKNAPASHHTSNATSLTGFTLVEILVALVVAGMLIALLASILGRGIVASSALGEASADQRSRVVLHRLLSMDLRGMIPETELTITEQGFTVETVNNHLVPGPLPMTVTWDFSQRQVRRTEEQPDLDYVQELLVISELRAWSLAFHDLTEGR
jgi:prepilin-type N-terminal cleavage/methylation domain-containing protein